MDVTMKHVLVQVAADVAKGVMSRTMYNRSGLKFFDEAKSYVDGEIADPPVEIQQAITVGLAFVKALQKEISNGDQDNDS
jgi:hypothetical protein